MTEISDKGVAMKLKGFDANHVSLMLPLEDLGTMGQALNEVCNGIHVVDFELKMGLDEIEAEVILDNIVTIYRKLKESGIRDLSVRFSRRELGAIIGALKEVCKGIDDIEFSTRIGAKRSEVDQILEEIVPIYHQMKLM
jgi:hypothetical protein